MSLSVGTLVGWIVELLGFIEGLRSEAIRLGADPQGLEKQIEKARAKREAAVDQHRKEELEIFSGGS